SIAVDDVDGAGDLPERAEGRGLPRELVVLHLAPGPGDGEGGEELDLRPVFLVEGLLARAPLEAGQAEERAAFVEEEEERVREAVRNRLVAEVRQVRPLAVGPELVRGIGPSGRPHDALGVEAEGRRQENAPGWLEGSALAAHDPCGISVGSS